MFFLEVVDVPVEIVSFLEDVICGPAIRRRSDRNIRRAKSISEVLIFASTSAEKKPAKYLKLGMLLKTLTGSRRILELLNRMGHCASYHTIQEIETELTIKANSENQLTPFGMSLENHMGTGVAWDNYDRFVETRSGKDMLHFKR